MIYYNLSIDNLIILKDDDLENISKYRKYLLLMKIKLELSIK